MYVFRVLDCLKQQGEQTSSDCSTIAVRPKKHEDQEPCALGKLIDHPEAMPEFTIENVVDYLINRKENDCLRAEDWKSFKAKLFKEGHVQEGHGHPALGLSLLCSKICLLCFLAFP